MSKSKPESRRADRAEQGPAPRRTRIQLDFSHEAYEQLLEVENLANARTHADAIRRALNLYRWFLKNRDNVQLRVKEEDGSIRELHLLEA